MKPNLVFQGCLAAGALLLPACSQHSGHRSASSGGNSGMTYAEKTKTPAERMGATNIAEPKPGIAGSSR